VDVAGHQITDTQLISAQDVAARRGLGTHDGTNV
jgi:hypothetical protein